MQATHSTHTLTPWDNRLSSAGECVADGVFQLVVRCAPSQEAAVGPLVRDALAEHLLGPPP
jgi:hypothetical protein